MSPLKILHALQKQGFVPVPSILVINSLKFDTILTYTYLRCENIGRKIYFEETLELFVSGMSVSRAFGDSLIIFFFSGRIFTLKFQVLPKGLSII